MPTIATVTDAAKTDYLSPMARRHKSQFIYDGEHADDRPLALTLLDLERFRVLARYPYLPSNWIHALCGGNEQRSYSRLARLARSPHSYLERRQDWYKHAVYKLTDKGYRAIGQSSDLTRDPFAHQLLQSMIEASLKIEVTDAELVGWDELVAGGKVNEGAIDQRAIPLLTDKLVPDGRPQAFRRDGNILYFLKEVDRATEPLVTNVKRRSIQEKFSHYAEFFDRKLWASHFGFPNCIVLFIATSEPRMLAMMQLAKKQIGDRTWLLFTHTKDWANELRYPAPPLGLYTHAWKRNGHPDYYLNRIFDA